MKKFLFYALSLFLISSIFFSCSEDDKSNPVLNISKKEIVFSNMAESEVLEVTTNQGDFTVKADKDWIKAKKENNKINVSVEENSIARDREGKIIISSGGLTKYVTIKQSKSEMEIVVTPSEFNIPLEGGEYRFTMQINVENYLVACGDEWIKLNANEKNNLVTFTVSENKSMEPRIGKIKFLVAGEIVKEVIVTQKGLKENFILPFLKFGATTAEVKQFEEERSNQKLRETDISGTGTQLAYSLQNKIFNEVNYFINLKGLEQASIFVKEGSISNEDKELFEKYLLSEGFEKKTMKGYETTISLDKVDKPMFVSTDKQVRAEFMSDRGHNHYRFIYYPVQTKDYPTLAALPYFEEGITKAQVESYESNHNGTFNQAESKINYGEGGAKKDMLYFNVAGDEIFSRIYWVYYEGQEKHGLKQVSVYYADSSLALYQGLNGDYYLTKEFIELAKKEGYDYSGFFTKYGTYAFKNKQNGLILTVRWYKHNSLGWVLRLSIH